MIVLFGRRVTGNQVRGFVWGAVSVLCAIDWSFTGTAIVFAVLQIAEG